jgi:tetratricopeptide (TPR) repeat protein
LFAPFFMMRFNIAFTLILIYTAVSAQQSGKPEIKESERQEMLIAAFQEFAFRRIQGFEEIPAQWNMKGKIQADLNEGINDLLEENAKEAEQSLTTVIEIDSTVWQAYYYRAAARKQLRNYKEATKDLEQTIILQPGLYEAYVELGKIYFLLRNASESERMIRKAIQLDKSKPAAHYVKGDINLIQNQIVNATHNFKDCLAADSLFHDARLKLAIIDLFEKKNEAQALKRFSIVLGYDSLQKNALLFRAILEMDNNKKQSVQDLSNLILVSPHHVMARYLRGTLYTQLGFYELAFTDLKEMVSLTSFNENEFTGEQSWIDKRIDIQNVGVYTLTRIYGLSEVDVIKVKQAYCLIVTGKFDMGIGVLNQVMGRENEPLCLYLIAVGYEHKGETTRRRYSFIIWH